MYHLIQRYTVIHVYMYIYIYIYIWKNETVRDELDFVGFLDAFRHIEPSSGE